VYPHHLHQAHVALAAQAGKHILWRNPLAAPWPKAGPCSLRPSGGAAHLDGRRERALYGGSAAGKVLIERAVSATSVWCSCTRRPPFQPGHWRSRRDLNGRRVLIDSGIHKVHLLAVPSREPAHLYAAALPQAQAQYEGEDGVVVMTRVRPAGSLGVDPPCVDQCSESLPFLGRGLWNTRPYRFRDGGPLAQTGAGQHRTDLAVCRRRQRADLHGPGVQGQHPDGPGAGDVRLRGPPRPGRGPESL